MKKEIKIENFETIIDDENKIYTCEFNIESIKIYGTIIGNACILYNKIDNGTENKKIQVVHKFFSSDDIPRIQFMKTTILNFIHKEYCNLGKLKKMYVSCFDDKGKPVIECVETIMMNDETLYVIFQDGYYKMLTHYKQLPKNTYVHQMNNYYVSEDRNELNKILIERIKERIKFKEVTISQNKKMIDECNQYIKDLEQ